MNNGADGGDDHRSAKQQKEAKSSRGHVGNLDPQGFGPRSATPVFVQNPDPEEMTAGCQTGANRREVDAGVAGVEFAQRGRHRLLKLERWSSLLLLKRPFQVDHAVAAPVRSVLQGEPAAEFGNRRCGSCKKSAANEAGESRPADS